MSELKDNIIQMTHTNEYGDTTKVTVEGQSAVPFWNTDLKMKAIIGLIGSVDEKDVIDDPQQHEKVQKMLRELELTLLIMRNMHQEFYDKNSYEYSLFEEFKE